MDDMTPQADAIVAKLEAHCPYCNAGLDRHALTGGKSFIHVLTRDADGRIAKSRPCTRS